MRLDLVVEKQDRMIDPVPIRKQHQSPGDINQSGIPLGKAHILSLFKAGHIAGSDERNRKEDTNKKYCQAGITFYYHPILLIIQIYMRLRIIFVIIHELITEIRIIIFLVSN
jgi:hypothetical protein